MKNTEDYESEIVEIKVALQEYPESETLQKRLSTKLSAWSKTLDFNVRVASNEQLQWTDEELGLITIPMAKKAVSGFNQVGDYTFEILKSNQDIITGGLVVERKTLQDLHSTLMNKDQRSRLYREISRYEADPRFNRFHLIAECTYVEFLEYVPEIFVYTQDSAPDTLKKNIINYFKRFYKIKVAPNEIKVLNTGRDVWIPQDNHQINIIGGPSGAEVFIDGVLRETLVKKINQYGKTQYFVRRGASEASKIETINSLENRIQVSFVGSRARAVEKYGGLVRQWCRVNYKTILNIDGI